MSPLFSVFEALGSPTDWKSHWLFRFQTVCSELSQKNVLQLFIGAVPYMPLKCSYQYLLGKYCNMYSSSAEIVNFEELWSSIDLDFKTLVHYSKKNS